MSFRENQGELEKMEKCALNEDQLAIYFDILKNPDTKKYNLGFYIQFENEIDLAIFQNAIYHLSSEEKALRIVISEEGGEYFQIVRDDMEPVFLFEDFSSRKDSGKNVIKKLEDITYSKYDLFEGPLVRTALVKKDADDYCFLVAMHHLISDTTSVKNYFQRFSDVYEKLKKDKVIEKPENHDFFEYLGEYEKATNSIATMNFWRNYCQEIEPLDFIMGRQDFDEEVCYEKALDETLSEKIKSYCQKNGFHVASFFLMIYAFIIKRYSQSKSNFCILTDYHGRTKKEYTNQGYYIKLLPINMDTKIFDTNATISESIRSIVAEMMKTASHFRISALKILKLLADNETLFNFNYFPLRLTTVSFLGDSVDIESNLLRFASENKPAATIIEKRNRYEMRLNVFANEKDAFLSDFPEKMALIAEQIVNGAKTIGTLDILSAKEKEKILIGFNDSKAVYPQDKTVTDLFEEQAEKNPDSIAVVFQNEKLRYHQLNEKTNQLGHYLNKQGVKDNDIVVIVMERSLNAILSMLGVLKAGGAYVVIDPNYPSSRIDMLLEDTKARIAITQAEFKDRIPDQNVKTIVLDELGDALSKEPKENTIRSSNLEDIVYCIYTSGSTGIPKGVLVKHRGLLNYVMSIVQKLEFEKGKTFALVSTLTADLGNTMIFPSLCVGGCLHVIPKEMATDSVMISDYFKRNRIDYLKIVPSHLMALLGSDKRCKYILPKEVLVSGGEALQHDWIAKIRKLGKCKIINHYGPAEATIGVSTFDVSQLPDHHELPSVPIGKPIANTQFYVLDSDSIPVPDGVMGELCVGGDCLAMGYLNRPEQTAERFIPNPLSQGDTSRLYRTGDLVRWLPDGNLIFLGRVDDQVKVRGFRVELGEIKNLLLKHENIVDAFILAKDKPNGLGNYIVAYVVLKNREKETTAAQLKEYISGELPDYMVPSQYVFLDKMPLTPNGKVDRKALPEPELFSQDFDDGYVAPRTPEEKMLCDVWKSILKVDKVSINDNFFELGGDSLIAIRATFKLRSQGVKGDVLKGIFSGKTIVEMAEEIGSGKEAIKPKLRKISEKTKELGKIIRIREGVNALRGIAVILLIFNHYVEGFSMRVFGRWHEQFYSIASNNLPGNVFFAFSFGIALGYAYWSFFESGKDKQAMRLLRSRIFIIIASFFLFVLPDYINNFVNGTTSITDWIWATYNILFFYFLAVLSTPLWFRLASITKKPILACLSMAVFSELLSAFFHSLKFGSAFDQGLPLFLKLNLQGYYAYFDLTACVTAGLAFGIWLQRVAAPSKSDKPIKQMIAFGFLIAVVGSFMGGLNVRLPDGDARIGVWQVVAYGGLSFFIILVFSQMDKMKKGAASWMALKGRGILSTIGLSTLPIFILHIYARPVKRLLFAMGLSDTLSVVLSVGAFLIGAYLVSRLIHRSKAPI